MEEIGRFPRTINQYKKKHFTENKTITGKERLQHGLDTTKATLLKTGTKFRAVQDKLQKTFPGVNDFNKRLEDEYNKKDLKKKNWWE